MAHCYEQRREDLRLAPPGLEASDDEDPSSEIATLHSASRFAPPKSDSEVQQARLQAISTSTKKDTAWCFNIWRDWSVANSTDVDTVTYHRTSPCCVQKNCRIIFIASFSKCRQKMAQNTSPTLYIPYRLRTDGTFVPERYA